MKQHGKIQIGDMSLDAEIGISEEAWEKPEDIEQLRQFFSKYRNQINDYLRASFERTYGAEYGKSPITPLTDLLAYIAKYPTWPEAVEGTITEPITNEKRLLE